MPQPVALVADIEARGYAHPEVLVSTQWVADHLADPNVRIAAVREGGHYEYRTEALADDRL